ncbi:MAG: M60 family metallopeptidase [Verrucomicrobiales bacterium]|nr:M60 family metallopeptidase [Verrucomicrobiales bacterium]
MPRVSFLSLWCLSFGMGIGFSQAQIPPELVTAERSKILEGVKSVPRVGAPGPVGIWGTLAFPILAAADGREGNELALAAAAGFGQGRVILFGQNGYLSGNAGGDLPRLMENVVRWVGNKAKPRIAVAGVRQSGFYQAKGFSAEELKGPIDAGALQGVDVLVLNAQGLTDEAEATAIIEWVQKGGGLIAGMTGWAYGQTSGGKELTTTHALNRALLPAGVGFTELSAFANLTAFDARPELPRYMNASEAITAIKKQREGGAELTPEEVRQGSNAIQVALAAQPPDRGNLRNAVASALGSPSATAVIPAPDAPLTQDQHGSARMRLSMETRTLRLTTGPDIAAHPAAATFPGQPPAEAPRVGREISIDPTVPGWHSTGLYAAAGEVITVTLPADQVGSGYALRIGCHSDTLYHLDKWLRAPDVTKSEQLSAAETRVSSAFGGLIYLEVPRRAAGAAFTVALSGAVEAPLFVLGQTTDEAWNSSIKNRPAPWAELACDHVILTLPTEVARQVKSPTALMEFWDKAITVQDEISNQARDRERPERIVADVQISAGYMHSGYPIMVPVSASEEMVTYNRLKFPGWGFHHEVGHNHQKPWFTFDGTGEVTNNVLAMYVYEAAMGKDWLIGHSAISEEARREHVQAIQKATDKWQLWKSSPFVALTTYIQLIQAFGWDSWRAYLHSFDDTDFGAVPASDDEARDQFLTRYSRITNRNLGPFFEAWGIPVSAAARAEVASLEPWMPAGL